MDLQELTGAMHRFVEAKGWYAPGTARPQTPRNLAISLNLEASEVLEHFQWGDQAPDRSALAGELADVALYLLQLASVSGIDLEQAILQKLALNYTRTWDQPAAAQPTQMDPGVTA
jgi:NTP pyrophosphatase (non-canonical NTP hydrolase)